MYCTVHMYPGKCHFQYRPPFFLLFKCIFFSDYMKKCFWFELFPKFWEIRILITESLNEKHWKSEKWIFWTWWDHLLSRRSSEGQNTSHNSLILPTRFICAMTSYVTRYHVFTSPQRLSGHDVIFHTCVYESSNPICCCLLGITELQTHSMTNPCELNVSDWSNCWRFCS